MSKSMNSIRGAVSFLLLVVFVSIGGSPASALPYDSGTRTGEVSCTTGTISVLNGVITGNTSCAGTAAIPDGVTSIGIGAFRNNAVLTAITFGPGSQLTTILEEAFQGATALTSINIPNSVTTIGSQAFLGATSLASITIPNSVTNIGVGAFAYATSLSTVTLGNSLTIIEFGAFLGATALTSINIPNSVTTIGSQAFLGATSLTSITIPNSVITIGDQAFQGATALTSINIPNSVTRIGSYAFYGATSLTSIIIPNSVTYMGIAAFIYNTSLSTVTLGNSLTIIEYGAFYGATSLTSITIPNSVTTIGSLAFSRATSLTSITIPNSVTTIGDEAFSWATSLSSITIPNSVNIFGLDVFTNTPALTQYTYCGTALTEGQLVSAGLTGKTKLCPSVFVPPMLPSFAPSISLNNGIITCTIGEYSRSATSVVFSLFVDGNHVATNFSSTGDHLPSWLAPWASASTIQRSATLQSASWNLDIAGDASRASCWTLAYSNNATGLISSEQISLR